MMKTTETNQRGAVLVVTLIMLSMITFLVMAFVGFSRFERASVEASLVRTEAGHALEIGLVKAQHEVMDLMGRELNHGLLVSRNQDGAGVGMGAFTNQATLVNFSKSLKDSPRVPVFIDRDGDGVQDAFPFFLDLNAAFNADGSRYQQSVTNNLGRFEGGDPDWIGLLQWPGKPHGPTNRFVARYAYLTVPAHKALNIRYHHNNLKRASANLDRFGRLQGIHPREINLAAPLWVLDPDSFPYRNYNPYFRSTDPRFSSYPNPEANNSAFGYAAELNKFGYQIEDAMHLSRSSKGYNELLNRNPGQATTYLRSLSNWLKKSSNPARATSYYQFMETFSSVPLPVEPEKFDVNSIRDEIAYGTAYIDTSQPGLPSAFPGLSGLKFSEPHGLKSGDKLEWAGSPSGFSLPPMIYDPITFDVITDNMTDAQRQDQLEQLLTKGLVHTTVPHHLVPYEDVQINLSGIDGGLTWLQSEHPRGPYVPVRVMKVFSQAPKPPQPFPTPVLTELRLETQDEIASPTPIHNFWGFWDGEKWILRYGTQTKLPNGDLPPEFENATCTLTYRAEPLRLDLIPYFVKVIDETTVTLHRSAQLDEFSKVNFAYPRSQFKYNSGVFTGVDQSARYFRNGNTVRFVNASGAANTEQNTFMLRKFGKVPLQFMLPDPADPSKPLKMKDGFTYTLQVVPVPKFHRFKHDGLTVAMEKMAGLMLNESLDTKGNSTTGSHSLGGLPLPTENDPADPMNPNPPFPLKMGIGGHQKSLGPWHHPKKGIPWGRGSASPFLKGSGRYTREMERIVQVAANIADLYSEPPPNISSHPKMFGYPLFGKDTVRFSKAVKPSGILRFGDIQSDCEISADIRQNSIFTRSSRSGLGLGEYFAYFQPDPSTFKNQKVKGRIYLEIGGIAGKPVAVSKELELNVLEPINGPVTWIWHLNKLVPRGGSGNREFWVAYNLRMACEAGREVRVYFNDEEVLSYANSTRLNPGQTSLLSVGADGVFTNLKPWVELGKQPGKAKCFDFENRQWQWYIEQNPPLGWNHGRYANTPNSLPTAYKGVFRRDEKNNVYLTGFQRNYGPLFGMDSNPAPSVHSWYKRFAPNVIGVKDRGRTPGNSLAPAITEFSLRTVYDRETKALYGRLTAEVQAPGQNGYRYLSRFRAVIESATYTLVYRNKTGTEESETVRARPGVAFRGGNGITIASPSSVNIVMIPTGQLQQPFAGWPKPKQSRFAQLTDAAIEISGKEMNPGRLKGYSLIDIRVDDLTLHVEGEVSLAGRNQRTVDYINSRLNLSSRAHFANVDPAVNARHLPQFGTREWLWVPDWNVKDVYRKGRDDSGVAYKNYYWKLMNFKDWNGNRRKDAGEDVLKVVGSGALAPFVGHPFWYRDRAMEMRKIDISWQVNDPLVNSHGSDFTDITYAPNGYFLRWNQGVKPPRWDPDPNTPQLRRQWVPRNKIHFPLTQFTHQPDVRMGVNLAKRNDASRTWLNGGDSAIQDPGVGYTPSANMDWRFPDISRGRMENVGWLGQVHRGTPWQTLYLKSKVPGLINNITAVNNAIVTAPNHNVSTSDEIQLTGKCPPEWELNFKAGGRLDAKGNIKPGELKGYAQRLNANQFRIWATKDPTSWPFSTEIVPSIGVADTSKLMAQNIAYWQNWAGSAETLPANDRRLLEAFSVGAGLPVRARFSVNNDSFAAWSAALCGLSIPERATKENDGSTQQQARILGANNPDLFPKRDQRIDAMDGRWPQIVNGINAARGQQVFTRVSDVLVAPQLSDGSPYLAVAWQHVATRTSGFGDELDAERIPMQLLSLLRVDDQPIYETYIFTEKLRPALRLNLAKYNGPAISPDGTILNYEVAGQTVRRVIYRLTGAEAWHRSLKNNHPGYWRDKDGNLQPLPPLRPKNLHSSTLQMN